MFEEGGEIRMEEHTNKIVISKRSEDTIEFDTSKIVEAISKIIDLFAGIGGMVKEMIDEAAKSFYAAMHEFCHWLMGGFFFGRRKEKKYNVIPGWISVVALAPCVLSQKIKFYNYALPSSHISHSIFLQLSLKYPLVFPRRNPNIPIPSFVYKYRRLVQIYSNPF